MELTNFCGAREYEEKICLHVHAVYCRKCKTDEFKHADIAENKIELIYDYG